MDDNSIEILSKAITSIADEMGIAIKKLENNEPLTLYDYLLLDNANMLSFAIRRFLKK